MCFSVLLSALAVAQIPKQGVGGGGGGGGGSFTQGWVVTRTGNTTLSIGTNAYGLNINGTVCLNPAASSTATITGTGTAFVYMSPACVLTVGTNTTAPTCDANCTAIGTPVSAFPSDGSVPIATWATSGSVLAGTGTNYVTPYETTPIAAGTNCSISYSGGIGTITCSPPAATFTTLSDGATVTFAIANAQAANASVTLGGNRTLQVTNPVNGGSYVLKIIQDGTGSRTLTLGTNGCTWQVSGGGAHAITPTTTAAAVDVLAFTYDGTNCYANFNKNFN